MTDTTSTELDITIDGTIFNFPPEWKVSLFDEWPQYSRPAGELGLQGCDVVALDGGTLWLIEMKDYTYPGARQPMDLWKTVGAKAAGTMAMLFALARTEADSAARDFARACQAVSTIHLALHIDVKDGGRKADQIMIALKPLKNKIRKAQRSLGLHRSFVTSTLASDPNTPWQARRSPQTRHQHGDR